jgi:hypothetical protein
VRRLFGWTAGLVGIAALARVLARRQARTAPPPTSAPDPAQELRRKLDESRGRAGMDDAGSTSAPAAEASARAEPTETLDERRARVHAKAQEALEAMGALQEPPT